MAIQTKNTLKTYFETGDRPTEQQFADLIDSFLHVNSGSVVSSITQNGGETVITLSNGVAYTISTAQLPETFAISAINGLQGALDNKVDKETGKGLSTNDFTNADKSKLDSLQNYTPPVSVDLSYVDGLVDLLNSKASDDEVVKSINGNTPDENGNVILLSNGAETDRELSVVQENDYSDVIPFYLLEEQTVATGVRVNFSGGLIELNNTDVKDVLAQINRDEDEVLTAKFINQTTGAVGYADFYTNFFDDGVGTINDYLYLTNGGSYSSYGSGSGYGSGGSANFVDENGDPIADLTDLPDASDYQMIVEAKVATNAQTQEEFNLSVYEKFRNLPIVETTSEYTSNGDGALTSGAAYAEKGRLDSFLSAVTTPVTGRTETVTARNNYQVDWVNSGGVTFDRDVVIAFIKGNFYVYIDETNLSSDSYRLKSVLANSGKILHIDVVTDYQYPSYFRNGGSNHIARTKLYSGYINTTPVTDPDLLVGMPTQYTPYLVETHVSNTNLAFTHVSSVIIFQEIQ